MLFITEGDSKQVAQLPKPATHDLKRFQFTGKAVELPQSNKSLKMKFNLLQHALTLKWH
jgi:hypothetical protein